MHNVAESDYVKSENSAKVNLERRLTVKSTCCSAEDLGMVPSIHMAAHNSSARSFILFCPRWALYTQSAQTGMQTKHPYTFFKSIKVTFSMKSCRYKGWVRWHFHQRVTHPCPYILVNCTQKFRGAFTPVFWS